MALGGFVAGGAVEARHPFYNRLEGRVLAAARWLDSHSDKASSEIPSSAAVPEPVEEEPVSLPYLSDKAFETTDNMLVFMFPSEELFRMQSKRVREIANTVMRHISDSSQTMKDVKVMFVVVPPKDPNSPLLKDTSAPIEIMCYKGQRKLRTSLDASADIPIADWETFFTFKSTPVDEELKACTIEHISGDEFEEKILTKSSPEHPILLQLYEKSCFLCFLMRPFLNSLAELLAKEPSVPFLFKRMDIEENDFPKGLPVVRGTPTFMMYRGASEAPERIEEFKPRDLVKRICADYRVSSETKEKMLDLVDRMTLRFQTFSGLVMWSTEAEKILQLISSGDQGHNATIPFDLGNSEDTDKELFNRLVAEYMNEDMLKVDTLGENLKALQRELTQAEKHAIMMGQVIGEKVVAMENQQS